MPNIGAYPGDNPPSLGAQDYSAPTNQPPTFTSSPVTGVRATQPYSYSVTTTDPEADTITLTAPVLPSWMSFVDNGDGTGTLSGTPTKANSGDHSVTLRAAHSGDSSTTDQSFTVHVRNFGVVRGMKGAVQIPTRSWREWRNYFVHTSAEITKADYHSAGGSIVDAAVDGPPGFTEYNTISICDDGTTFSNLYNPGSGNITVPPVGNLMMSWYMKREDGGAASVGINSTTGSCYTRIFSGTSPAGQVGEEAVGDGWYRGWCTAYGLTTGSMINTGLLRASTQYANDGNSKLYVTCFQLEPIVPGVVDETTGPSPFRPTTDWADPTIGERKRLDLGAYSPGALIQNYLFYPEDLSDTSSGRYSAEGTCTITPAGLPPPLNTRIRTTWNIDGPAGFNGWRILDISGIDNKPAGKNIMYSFFVAKTSGATTWPGFTMGTVTPNYLGLVTMDTDNGLLTPRNLAQDLVSSGVIDWDDNWWRVWMVVAHGADAASAVRMTMVWYTGVETGTITGNWSGVDGVADICGPMIEDAAGKTEPSEWFDPHEANGNNMPYYRSPNNLLYIYKGAEQPLKDFGALALGFNMDLVTDLVYDLVQDLVRD